MPVKRQCEANHQQILLLAFLMALLFGCASSSYREGIFEDSFNRYRVQAPSSGWKQVKVKQANLSFFNTRANAAIMVNSTCDTYRDAPLRAMANHMFIGIENKTYLLQESHKVDGREAVYSVVKGMLDGAPIKIAAITIAKNYCTYDLTYSAPPETFEDGLADFERLVDSFSVLERKR